jgi:hypothetical protein
VSDLSDTKIEERVRVRFTTRKPKKTEEKREQGNRVLVQRKRILSEKRKKQKKCTIISYSFLPNT